VNRLMTDEEYEQAMVDEGQRRMLEFDADVRAMIEKAVEAERLAITEAIKEEMTDELEDEAYHLCIDLIAKIQKRDQL